MEKKSTSRKFPFFVYALAFGVRYTSLSLSPCRACECFLLCQPVCECVCVFVCVSAMCEDKQALCSIVRSLSSAGCEGPLARTAQHTDWLSGFISDPQIMSSCAAMSATEQHF